MSLRLVAGLALLVFLAGGMTAPSQERERKAPAAETAADADAAREAISLPEGSVKKVGETRYRIGEIEFDARTREIRFPATVNMREGGPLEYILVHERGKVHESIFTTAVSPLALQVAMKLLRYQAGYGDVFNRLLRPEMLEKEGGTEADRGDSLIFHFQAEGAEKAVPVYEFVIDGENAEAMTPGGWIYTGSVVEDGAFMAEAEGSIIAIYLDHLALFNMTREGADIDERWGARSSAIPEIGTKGTLTIQAFVEPKEATKEK
ncbi:MAG: hypothetical protein GXX91_14250 [Verrucomicrobiaceae bacterium]|nr:hypothetical protein [Verrucomicrobiaceae bacterium]